MGRLTPRSTRDMEKLLRHFGYRRVRREGGHDFWTRDNDGRTVSLPAAKRAGTIPVGTVKGVLDDAGISREDALRFWGTE